MEFERFFKYIYFILIHLIAFSMMYSINLEMLGYAVGIIMSFITAGFLWSDIYYSPKANDPVIFVLLLSMLGGIISLSMFATFLTTTHSKYNKKGSKILLTKETRAKLTKYRSLYFFGYLTIVALALSFFLHKNPVPVGNLYEFFFQLPTNILSTDTLFFAMKVLLSMGALGITGSLLYTANELKKQNTKQLYIPEGGKGDEPHRYPYRYKRSRTSFIDDIRGFFRNVNMNYVMNYNIERT
jgi:hypothetical protein